jgi:hypothetical protein
MSSLLQKVATLSLLLSELEKEIGIEDIGTIEKKVLLAIADLSSLHDVAEIKRIKEHPLTSNVTQPSFYRALNNLQSMGRIKKVGIKRGVYAIVE